VVQKIAGRMAEISLEHTNSAIQTA
jgi:hypothetical protein